MLSRIDSQLAVKIKIGIGATISSASAVCRLIEQLSGAAVARY